ncbi:MAG: NUDIX hydrolase [Planctomycetales bacterium]
MADTPEWLFRQSAVIPYREKKHRIQVLLITSRKSQRWVVPKGVVEPDLTPQDSAEKEAYEEAGIEGRVFVESIGSYTYKKWGGVCDVEVFPMEVELVHDFWPEDSFRTREWTDVSEAAERVREKLLKRMLLELPALVAD